jgi:hypothetical protein
VKKLIAKIKGIDPFYSEIRKNQVELYQAYFERLLKAVNVDNFTKRSSGEEYDKTVADQDDKKIENIVVEEAQIKDELLPVYLQVIFEQYFFADVWKRETDKHNWVHRVIHRKSVDYFPDPMRVYTTLFE